MDRKQRLLRVHRRNKRLLLVGALIVLIVAGQVLPWWLLLLFLVVAWVAHEAWFSDHQFYAPCSDYRYTFPPGTRVHDVSLDNGHVHLPDHLQPGQTLVLEVTLHSSRLGRWLEPYVCLGEDRQYFELGARGKRYLNLSGLGESGTTLPLSGRFCRVAEHGRLYVFDSPDYSQRRMMILAPHADDAELAAFGLYSMSPQVSMVTVTRGEIEASNLLHLGLDAQQAARLKGRLRCWNSLAVPLWGGVPQHSCVQLGYYCLQLSSMAKDPAQAFGSRESGQEDIRDVRQHNPLRLPGDENGQPTWNNLLADLVAVLEHFKPEVLVVPHPSLDPHPDHVAVNQALHQALEQSSWKPGVALLYANHLHDNDRWPMGPAGAGVALPPAFGELPAYGVWSVQLSADAQLNKAMALAMQHDLQGRLSFKRCLRRWIQQALVARRWPSSGSDEFFRKAVRRHELFWVQSLTDPERAVAPAEVGAQVQGR